MAGKTLHLTLTREQLKTLKTWEIAWIALNIRGDEEHQYRYIDGKLYYEKEPIAR